jgi:hypothetical protein
MKLARDCRVFISYSYSDRKEVSKIKGSETDPGPFNSREVDNIGPFSKKRPCWNIPHVSSEKITLPEEGNPSEETEMKCLNEIHLMIYCKILPNNCVLCGGYFPITDEKNVYGICCKYEGR